MRFLSFFIAEPERAAVVAVAFLLVGAAIALSRKPRRIRGWPCLTVSVLWGLCAYWETIARESRWNIRPDALLIYPLLLALTLAAIAFTFRRMQAPPRS